MSIGWIAEDIAELTGAVIGSWDFPTNIIRKTSGVHNNGSLLGQLPIRRKSTKSLLQTYSLLAA